VEVVVAKETMVVVLLPQFVVEMQVREGRRG
jgi:hypothetical protein